MSPPPAAPDPADLDREARYVAPETTAGDADDAPLRPRSLADFVGQPGLKENLSIFIEAARARAEALDHVLLHGPPGLGKTTLAQIVARELAVGFRATSGPVIARAGDLAAILTNLQAGDVLFIDEIHRLNPAVEEILYPAMEDFQLDLVIGEGPAARSVKIDLPRFTLVGATTRSGLLTTPLRERFGIPLRLDFYNVDDLQSIVARAARLLAFEITAEAAREVARRSRGTPRVASRLLRRVRDFAAVAGHAVVEAEDASAALSRLAVDHRGLDEMDRRYLGAIAEKYGGGPVGVDTIAAVLSEHRDMIEDVIEPFLIQEGLIQRTPRGRMLARAGYAYLGLPEPARPDQFDLLDRDRARPGCRRCRPLTRAPTGARTGAPTGAPARAGARASRRPAAGPRTRATSTSSRCASTTRTPTPAASSTTSTTSSSPNGRAPRCCVCWATTRSTCSPARASASRCGAAPPTTWRRPGSTTRSRCAPP